MAAIELDPSLAARARGKLGSYPDMRVACGNGMGVSFEAADVISVNPDRPTRGSTGRRRAGDSFCRRRQTRGFWTTIPRADRAAGVVFRSERRSSELPARWISAVAIFACEGARDPLSEAFAKGG